MPNKPDDVLSDNLFNVVIAT